MLTAAALIDLIPNATLTPVTWLVAGGLAAASVNVLASLSPAQMKGSHVAPLKMQSPRSAEGGSASWTKQVPASSPRKTAQILDVQHLSKLYATCYISGYQYLVRLGRSSSQNGAMPGFTKRHM